MFTLLFLLKQKRHFPTSGRLQKAASTPKYFHLFLLVTTFVDVRLVVSDPHRRNLKPFIRSVHYYLKLKTKLIISQISLLSLSNSFSLIYHLLPSRTTFSRVPCSHKALHSPQSITFQHSYSSHVCLKQSLSVFLHLPGDITCHISLTTFPTIARDGEHISYVCFFFF